MSKIFSAFLFLTGCTTPCSCATNYDIIEITEKMERAFSQLEANMELARSTPQVCMPNDNQ